MSATTNAWCAAVDDVNQWMTLELISNVESASIVGIYLQGKTQGSRIGYPTKVKFH